LATVVLDHAILKANAQTWRRHSGVALRAVVKSDGYGWGIANVVRAVDDEVDGYCVADLVEFNEARRITAKPIAILGDILAKEIARVLDAGGIPNLNEADAIAAAGAWTHERGKAARVRVGLRSAAAWAGIDERDAATFAGLLSNERLDVECWTHLTDPSLYASQRAAFARFVESLRAAGVAVVGCDVDATASCAVDPTPGATSIRIGVGLFGSGSTRVAGLACALAVRAPIVRVMPAEGQLVGYGTVRAPHEGYLQIVRCGYGDGFPRIVEPFESLLSVGMQYTVVASLLPPAVASIDLVTTATDLDRLAAAARLAPHEIVVRLGHASRVQSAVS
jgi:alanine racemase